MELNSIKEYLKSQKKPDDLINGCKTKEEVAELLIDGNTGLHSSVIKNDINSFLAFLDSPIKSNLNIQNSGGNSALHLSITFDRTLYG